MSSEIPAVPAPATGVRRAIDVGTVTTAVICVALIVTLLVDQFTDADLRVPLRIFDLACVGALLVWQFTRINRDLAQRRRHAQALGEEKAKAERARADLERSRAELDLALGVGGLAVWHVASRLDLRYPIQQPAFLSAACSTDETALAMCGFPPHTWLTVHDFLEVIHPDDRKAAIATLERIFHAGTHPYRDRYRVVRNDGDIRILEVRGTLRGERVDSHYLQVSITGIAKDITDEEALKANLLAKAEEARRATEAKGRFLAMMSHELRTPMNGVLGMLDMVIDTGLHEEQRTMLVRCRQSARILLTILNDILDFSKIEAGKLQLESTSLSPRSLVADVCADHALQAHRKSVDVVTTIDPHLPQFLLGDPVRVRQILGNLVSNAVKFTARGRVDVRAMASGASTWTLEVEDTGPGIAPEVLSRLFEPFQQAEASTARRHGGTGLGLSILKQLADLMGGTVGVRSDVGVGSCFRVVLPLQPWVPSIAAQDHDPADATDATTPLPTLEAKRLLLAEDSPINQDVIQRQLARLGHRCECVEDGELAWTVLRGPDAGFDALITDGDMPHLDGYGLTARIRAWEKTHDAPRLPILAMTANAMQGDRERALAAGMDGYVAKPVDMHQLQQALVDLFANVQPTANTAPTTDKPGPAPDEYAHLQAACGGDIVAISKVLATFLASVGEDAAAFRTAWNESFEGQMRYLSHKMASGLLQVGEERAARALQAIEHAGDLDEIRVLYAGTEAALWDALARARTFLARHGRGA